MSNDRVYIDLDSIMKRIREKIVSRGAVGIDGLGRLFRIADDNGSRNLDLHEELPKLLGDIGVLINKTEIDELARILDRDGNGMISYDEFIYHLAPPMNARRIDIVNKAYNSIDKNNDGHITIEDIKKINPDNGTRRTSAQAFFDNFTRCFDKNGNGSITREEFIDYYRDISPSIDNDEYFETMLKNAWRIQ